MKKYLNIKTGLFLSFLLIISVIFFGDSQDSGEVLKENKAIAQVSEQHDSQKGTSVSKKQENQPIEIEFYIDAKFEPEN